MNNYTTMQIRNRVSHLTGAALLFAACSSSNPTASHEDNVQVAQVLGTTVSTGAEPTAVGVVLDLATGFVPQGLTFDDLGRFSGDRGGLTFNGTITCTDLGIATPTPCSPATATATVTGSWSGQLQTPRMTISATRTGTWTVSGFQTSTVTINGTSHVDLTSQFASASDKNHKNLVLAIDATYEAATVERTSNLATGGDIQYVITGQRTHMTPGLDTSQTFTIDATLTFHPDHTATLVIDGKEQFEVNLDTGETTPEND
jgi:hypothetical protein